MESTEIHKLDCSNLNCPMPIVRIAKKFRDINIGEQVEIVATDPAFKADVEAWVRKTSQKLISFTEEGKSKIAVLEKIK
ncbi:sulfurtransferase TusA family protein [Flammeovirga kamogawensis]|uniref:Sulfurtransferase TusA family protein n=1 Tax=Flammeovirga kamogawensis TaxID=373891 RepID=A0ABX8GV54_9BACT|nr:sulfurtransferase TusA family protein [Flammeovirga kamogawensis]MBB6461601.1 TusA-related sulfurtransferase [Flammeovirga kamogawensis]QWG07470.1 sulfurtransferase TusA family protein [Flammeovirga kamogawensis]TRX69282.1 SirA family protein [Flammeovirga kamogawensis]